MRWEAVFHDLEAEFEAAEQAAFAAEVDDRTRREIARIHLTDRLRAAGASAVTVGLSAGGAVAGRVTGVGADWLLLSDDADRELLVPLHAVATVTGLGREATDPEQVAAVEGRLDLRYALRLLARNRASVLMTFIDRSTLAGTIERVGADWIDVTEDPDGDRRTPGRVRTASLAAISVIRPR